eukprot:718189-Prymnesium_polylepis.1
MDGNRKPKPSPGRNPDEMGACGRSVTRAGRGLGGRSTASPGWRRRGLYKRMACGNHSNIKVQVNKAPPDSLGSFAFAFDRSQGGTIHTPGQAVVL